MVRISSPIQELIAEGVMVYGVSQPTRAALERHRWIERAEPHARAQAGARIRTVFEVGLGEVDGILVVVVPGRRFDVRREHFAERLIPRGAQAAELDALVILVEAQLALAVVEEGFAAVGAHGAQVERELPSPRACALRERTQARAQPGRIACGSVVP